MPYLDKEELYKREPLVLISLIDLKDKKPGDIIVQKRFGENLYIYKKLKMVKNQ